MGDLEARGRLILKCILNELHNEPVTVIARDNKTFGNVSDLTSLGIILTRRKMGLR
jgi:hypothetical protein